MASSQRVCIVLPTYNEAGSVGTILKSILKTFKDLPQYEPTILVVDDASPDGTALVVGIYAKHFPNVHLLSRPKKAGLGSAYLTGFYHAQLRWNPDIFVQMDADGSHQAEAIPKLLAELSHADVVIGSRYIPGGEIPQWSSSRRLVSKSANFLARVMMRQQARDATSGFRAFKSEVLTAVQSHSFGIHGFAYQLRFLELAAISGYRICEAPISFCDRLSGESKLSMRDVIEFLTLACAAMSRRMWFSLRPPVRAVPVSK